jgi:hypothetical protein
MRAPRQSSTLRVSGRDRGREITHGDQQEGVKTKDLAIARSRRSAGRSPHCSASEGGEQGGERDAERTAVRQDRFTGDPGSHSGARATGPSQARFPLRHTRGSKRLTITTSLGAVLEAFILEHEYCGDLDGGVEGDRVCMTRTCYPPPLPFSRSHDSFFAISSVGEKLSAQSNRYGVRCGLAAAARMARTERRASRI